MCIVDCFFCPRLGHRTSRGLWQSVSLNLFACQKNNDWTLDLENLCLKDLIGARFPLFSWFAFAPLRARTWRAPVKSFVTYSSAQMKEDECLRAKQERDEMQRQCQDEKDRFLEMAKRRLRRSSGDMSSASSVAGDSDGDQRIKTLEKKLKIKEQELKVSRFKNYCNLCVNLIVNTNDIRTSWAAIAQW